jgi:hypothetical protein
MNINIQSIPNTQQSFITKTFIVAIILATVFLLSSCLIQDLSTDPQNDNNKVKGSGVIISEEIELPHFKSITMNTAGLVTVSSNTSQYVEVTVDDNILEYISIYVDNEILVIEIVENVSLSKYELTVDVMMTDLRSLATNSAGSIKGLNTFEENQINLMVNSAGSISLDLKVNQLNSMINSAGNLLLSGQAVHHNSVLSSAGNLNAFDLQTETTTILSNSAGNAHVSVTELLDVTINSVGCVYYKGTPRIIQNINSIGCVVSAN